MSFISALAPYHLFHFPIFLVHRDCVFTFLYHYIHRFPWFLTVLISCLSLLLLVANCTLLFRLSSLLISSQCHCILSLFAGSLCDHVQYAYRSTLIPKHLTSPSFHASVRCFLSPFNNSSFSLQFMYHVCFWLHVPNL